MFYYAWQKLGYSEAEPARNCVSKRKEVEEAGQELNWYSDCLRIQAQKYSKMVRFLFDK